MTSLLPDRWLDMPISALTALTPVSEIPWSEATSRGVSIAIKQEQLLDEYLSGNKLYKLYFHLKSFLTSGKQALATFGGAYSNHLYALAAAGQSLGLKTLGIVRGEEPAEPSATLNDIKAMGMRLVFVSREDYKRKTDSAWLEQMNILLGGNIYWVPEGGGDSIGARGCQEWAKATLNLTPWEPDVVCIPAGTGATASGVLAAAAPKRVHAYLALKGRDQELREFEESVITKAAELSHCDERSLRGNFKLESDYHCGGYARVTPQLKAFISGFEHELGVQLDPVYSAKMFYGISQQLQEGIFKKGDKILVLHTGGLQGRRGYSL